MWKRERKGKNKMKEKWVIEISRCKEVDKERQKEREIERKCIKKERKRKRKSKNEIKRK